jgi:hypothetical protein
LITIFVENTAVLKKTLEKFTIEKLHSDFIKAIEDCPPLLTSSTSFIGPLSAFDEITTGSYFYSYYRDFVSPGFRTRFFEVYRVKCFLECENSRDGLRLSIEDKLNSLTHMLMTIMTASKAFICVNKYRADSQSLYTVGRCGMTSFEIPFELTDEYFVCQAAFNKEEPLFNFFTPAEGSWKGLEKKLGEDICVIRLFHSTLVPGENPPPLVCFAFVFDKVDDFVHWAQIKENIRDVFLIKADLLFFFTKNFDHDQFNSWIDAEVKNSIYENRYRNVQHNANKYRFNLINATVDDINANAYAWIVSSDIFIGNRFATYLLGKSLIATVKRVAKSQMLFNEPFTAILKYMPHVLSASADVHVSIEPNVFCLCDTGEMQHIIIQLVMNAFEFQKSGTKMAIDICTNGEYLDIRNDCIYECVDVCKLNQLLRKERCELRGITLFTVFKYILQNFGKEVVPFCDGVSFTVRLPIFAEGGCL